MHQKHYFQIPTNNTFENPLIILQTLYNHKIPTQYRQSKPNFNTLFEIFARPFRQPTFSPAFAPQTTFSAALQTLRRDRRVSAASSSLSVNKRE
jgi:hypothetical protein